MPRTKLVLFLLLILSQLLFAAEILDMGWQILGATIMLMIILLASTNMIAQALNMPALEAWVKTELREMIAGGILTAVVGSLIVLNANPIVLALTAGATTDYETDIINFTDDMITLYSDAYEHVLHISHFLTLRAGLATSMNIPLYFFGFTFSAAPFAGYSSFLIPLSHAAGALSNGMYIYMIMRLLLDFFAKISILILPFGFVFRFIPYTRQMGNTIIALIIGANILFPASIILVKDFHSMITVPHPNITPAEYEKMDLPFFTADVLGFICSEKLYVILPRMLFNLGELLLSLLECSDTGPLFLYCEKVVALIKWPIFHLLIMSGIDSLLLPFQFEEVFQDPDTIFEAVFRFTSDTTGLVLLAYIDAIVVGIITIGGTRSIAAALGGEYFLGTISRLV